MKRRMAWMGILVVGLAMTGRALAETVSAPAETVSAPAETVSAPAETVSAPAETSSPVSADAASVPKSSLELMIFEEYQSLDQVLLQRTGVSTVKGVTSREVPGIVTIISSEEIANTGARDLIDVLRLVPGIEFGADVAGSVGLIVRGLWAIEGKALLLWDGQPLNDSLYGSLSFGNHFPVEQIKQVEIIRGPGSVIYGGAAELAVINIKTKRGADLKGLVATALYGQMAGTYGHRNLSLSFGQEFSGLDVSAHVFWGQGNRSDRDYTSYYGGTYNTATASQLKPFMLDFALAYQGLELRTVVDQYHTTERDWWGANFPAPVKADFDTTFFDALYTWRPTDTLTITPHVNWKSQVPYKRNGLGTVLVTPEGYTEAADHEFEIDTWRQTEGITAAWDATPQVNLLAGWESYQDQAEYIEPVPSNHDAWVSFYNNAAFAQGLADLGGIANLTAGARYERHSQYGASFVPRIGLTKVLDPWHFKLLYSQAFRAPYIENIGLNADIKPEKAEVAEFEAGYRFNDKVFMTVNVFDIAISDTIMYFADVAGEHYINAGRMGSRGSEIECQYRDDWGFFKLNYAFYRATYQEAELYSTPGYTGRFLGAPTHKATLTGKLRVLPQLTLNPTVIALSQRLGYTRDIEGLADFAPAVLINLYAAYAVLPGLNLGLGVEDLLNAAPVFIQPYNGLHAPTQGPSREIVAKATYSLNF